MRLPEKTVISFFVVLLTSASAFGQDLFTFTGPDGAAVVQSAAVADGDTMGPEIIGPLEIDLDLELLRSRPEGLLIPVVAGGLPQRVLLRHFEDRGNGDLVWSGAAAGGWAETHVLTVLGDAVIGSFWDDSGYRTELVASATTGAGTVVSASNAEDPDGDWCLDAMRDAAEVRQAAGGRLPTFRPVARQAARAEEASGSPMNEVDITFVITEGARKHLRLLGGAHGYAQSLVDFGNQIFRNTELPIRLNVRGLEKDQFGYPVDAMFYPTFEIRYEGVENRVQAIRSHHGSDLIHILSKNRVDESGGGIVCGAANIYGPWLDQQMMATQAYGYTNMICDERLPGYGRVTFIHELGHNFGLNHNWQVPHWPKQGTRWPHVGYGFLSNPRADSWRNPLEGPQPTGPFKETGAVTVMGYNPREPGWLRVPLWSAAAKRFDLRNGEYGMKSKDKTTRWKMGRKNRISSRQLLLDTGPDMAALSDYQWRLSRGPDNLRIAARDNGDETISLDFAWDDMSDDEWGFQLSATVWREEVDRIGWIPLIRRVPETHLPGYMAPADAETLNVTLDALPPGRGMTWTVASRNYDGPTPSLSVHVGPVERPGMVVFGAPVVKDNGKRTRFPFWIEGERAGRVKQYRVTVSPEGRAGVWEGVSVVQSNSLDCRQGDGCGQEIAWDLDYGFGLLTTGEIMVVTLTAENDYGSQSATIRAVAP